MLLPQPLNLWRSGDSGTMRVIQRIRADTHYSAASAARVLWVEHADDGEEDCRLSSAGSLYRWWCGIPCTGVGQTTQDARLRSRIDKRAIQVVPKGRNNCSRKCLALIGPKWKHRATNWLGYRFKISFLLRASPMQGFMDHSPIPSSLGFMRYTVLVLQAHRRWRRTA